MLENWEAHHSFSLVYEIIQLCNCDPFQLGNLQGITSVSVLFVILNDCVEMVNFLRKCQGKYDIDLSFHLTELLSRMIDSLS